MRPATLCKLVKGKIIDTQRGFVDTWNYLVDFVANLKGDSNIELDRFADDHPVIRLKGSIGGAASPEIAANQIVVTGVFWTNDSTHGYCIKVERGRLAIGSGANAGKIVVAADAALTQYIETTPHTSEFDV